MAARKWKCIICDEVFIDKEDAFDDKFAVCGEKDCFDKYAEIIKPCFKSDFKIDIKKLDKIRKEKKLLDFINFESIDKIYYA